MDQGVIFTDLWLPELPNLTAHAILCMYSLAVNIHLAQIIKSGDGVALFIAYFWLFE